jgi:hypothetical protein
MTIFEYLSVAVSMVLALTLGKLIAATPHVFARGARDVVHATYFLLTGFVVLAMWWYVWPLHDKTSWNFVEFLLMMGSPVSLYLAAHVLVSDVPREVKNWGAHFARIHRWYFSAVFATTTLAVVRVVWVLGAQPSFATGLAVLSVVIACGIASSSRRVHAGVLIFWLLFQGFAVTQQFTTAS